MEGLKIIKAGKLEKSAPLKSSCVRRWNERFFVLQSSPAKLTYYENEGVFKAGKSQGKSIDLQGCIEVMKEAPQKNYPYLFSVKTSKTSSHKGRVFLINAKNAEDRKEWVDCIRKAIDVEVEKKDDEVVSLGRTATGATQKSKASSGYGSLQEDCEDSVEEGLPATFTKLATEGSYHEEDWNGISEPSQLVGSSSEARSDGREYMTLNCPHCGKDFENCPAKDLFDVPQGNESSQGSMANAIQGLQVKCPHCHENIGYMSARLQIKTKKAVENAWDSEKIRRPSETSDCDKCAGATISMYAEDSSEEEAQGQKANNNTDEHTNNETGVDEQKIEAVSSKKAF